MCRAANPEKGRTRGGEKETKQGAKRGRETRKRRRKEEEERKKQGRRASAGDPDVVKVAGPVQGSGDQKGWGRHRAEGRKIRQKEKCRGKQQGEQPRSRM